MIRYDAILFDFDGTLADTESDVWDSVEYAANLAGGSIPDSFRNTASNLGLPMEEIFLALKPVLSMEKFNKFKEDIKYHYRKISLYPNTVLYPGMEEFLQLLIDRNIPRYIITLKPIEPLVRILSLKKWEHYFTGWYSTDSFEGRATKKEEIIYYLLRNELSGCKTVYIGDTYSDVIAARKNNMDCIGIAYGDGNSEKLIAEKPNYLVKDVYELIKLFEER